MLACVTHKIERERGFTLIELLVVISIIALLSSIIIASLGTARTKARDAAAMESFQSIRTEAELYLNSSGLYSATLCDEDTGELWRLREAVEILTNQGVGCSLSPGHKTWVAWATLLNGTNLCLDSTNKLFINPSGVIQNVSADNFHCDP